VLGKGGALLGTAAVAVLLAGGVGAAFAIQPEQQPPPVARPTTEVITVLDAPPPPEPAPTTTTTTARAPAPEPQRPSPPAQASGSGAATITVLIQRPGG
jgi:hypothetical protein